MLKKIAVFVLCLLVLLTGTAMADSIGVINGISITVIPPDGYTVEPMEMEGGVLAAITSDGAENAQFSMSVAYSEKFAGYTLDMDTLSSEQYEQMYSSLTEDFDSPEIQILTAEDGSNVILVDEQGADSDYAYLLTIYQGYFAEVNLFKTSGQLSADDIQMARDILSSTRTETVEE